MKKLAAILALIPALALAEPAMLPSHAVNTLIPASLPWSAVEGITMAAMTTTWVNNRRTAVINADTGTETMVSTATVGLDLTDIGGVVVILKTTGTTTATAGGTLQAYLYNPDAAVWARAADLDLTATAVTSQTWPAIYVPVSRGRLYYNPNGIGSTTQPTIYLVGQPKPAL